MSLLLVYVISVIYGLIWRPRETEADKDKPGRSPYIFSKEPYVFSHALCIALIHVHGTSYLNDFATTISPGSAGENLVQYDQPFSYHGTKNFVCWILVCSKVSYVLHILSNCSSDVKQLASGWDAELIGVSSGSKLFASYIKVALSMIRVNEAFAQTEQMFYVHHCFQYYPIFFLSLLWWPLHFSGSLHLG